MEKELKLSALSAIAPFNTKTFNIVLAREFGLNAAVYWNALADIGVKVSKKHKYDPQGFFKLDRAYVELVTTLTTEQQLECDQILVKEGVLAISPENPDFIAISAIEVVAIELNGEFKKVITVTKDRVDRKPKPKPPRKVLSEEEKAAKRQAIISAMMGYIIEPDPDLYQAYYYWVEALLERRINKVIVANFVATLQAAKLDKQTAIYIINHAAEHFWKDATLAITLCLKDISKNPSIISSKLDRAVINKPEVDKGQVF